MKKNNLQRVIASAAKQSLYIALFCVMITGCGASGHKEQATFKLYNKGTEKIVNYNKYGEFKNIGSPDYEYIINDQAGLSKAVGEGIYPNASLVLKDPEYKNFKDQGRLKGAPWDFINSTDYQANFYKWATAPEERGVKLFYTAFALEKAGHIRHAIKAYYALVVNFPKTIGWTYWHTPWPVAQVAIDRINFLCKEHPQLKWQLRDASIIVKNGYDENVRNDTFIIKPGRLIHKKAKDAWKKTEALLQKDIIKSTGDERIRLVQYSNGRWQLLVDSEPYIVKGIAYQPSKIGQSPDEGTLEDWMQADYNGNNKIDGPYDSWVDVNKNNRQDETEEAVGDFNLLWKMGANTIRIYHHASNKQLLKDLYQNYGIMVLMGDFLGAYAVGSGTTWYKGTDYSDTEHKKNMLESLKAMVEEYRDEPYVLMWVLGNENNYGVANNAKKDPQSYYRFVNEAAEFIKSIDPHKRPVAICNGETIFLDIFAKECPSVDIFGLNSYRGDYGFGHLWLSVKEETGKPVLVTEYGCPAHNKYRNEEESEQEQADFLKNCWIDIAGNSGPYGIGNSIGGVLFEWVDEWWKAYEPSLHDTKPLWAGSFPDGWMHEEWLGVTSQGSGKKSPYQRVLRKVYYEYQKLWRN